jgi:hypothetical protein
MQNKGVAATDGEVYGILTSSNCAMLFRSSLFSIIVASKLPDIAAVKHIISFIIYFSVEN